MTSPMGKAGESGESGGLKEWLHTVALFPQWLTDGQNEIHSDRSSCPTVSTEEGEKGSQAGGTSYCSPRLTSPCSESTPAAFHLLFSLPGILWSPEGGFKAF